MGIDDVGIIGVGKDAYNEHLSGMIEGRILPWVEDVQEDGYPVWTNYGAVQRTTYFLDREGNLIHQFNITTLDPTDPDDYEYLINLILDYRAENGPSVYRIPDDTDSIQVAIDESNDGDIILISPGSYRQRIDFLDMNITIASLLYSGFDESFVSETILDGELGGTVVTINGGQDESAILLGITIINGYNEITGGGILIENSSPTIERNIIRNNFAGSCGGEGAGIAIRGESYPYIFGNEIYENTVQGECDCICYFGGGIYVDSTAFPVVGGSETLGNKFYNNYSDYGYDLYRNPPLDTTDWTPIYAHHNYFQECPPDYNNNVFPENGWDLENCHTLLDVVEDEVVIANDFHLFQNYPNPFNPKTTIRFNIPEGFQETMSLQVFDITGRLVKTLMNDRLSPGQHQIHWDAVHYPTGIYFFQLRSGDFIQTQKALLVK
tara:strand:+ start:2009 stop:3319 length:1311 start_codon:yes stop_codon:yes gene_type:complete